MFLALDALPPGCCGLSRCQHRAHAALGQDRSASDQLTNSSGGAGPFRVTPGRRAGRRVLPRGSWAAATGVKCSTSPGLGRLRSPWGWTNPHPARPSHQGRYRAAAKASIQGLIEILPAGDTGGDPS